MEIPNSYIINDTRTLKDFKTLTICGYKKKDVLKTFQNSIINNKLEDAIRWCVEMHATGMNAQIWRSLKNIYFKYININNPKFFFYLFRREKDYIKILNNYSKKNQIHTKNNQEIRNLYAELIAISVLTKKNNLFLPKSLPLINSKSYLKEEIQKRMISKDLNKIQHFIYNNTSNDIKLALNEIINNLTSKKGTYQNCIYWYLWLEKLKNKNKKIKEKIILDSENKFSDHWIFILWNMINSVRDTLEKNNSTLIKKLFEYYKEDFKLSYIQSKKYYILMSFYIIFNDLKWTINLYQSEYLIIQTNANINKMYQNINKNIDYKDSTEEIKPCKSSMQINQEVYTQEFYTKRHTNIDSSIDSTIDSNIDANMDIYTYINNNTHNEINNSFMKKCSISNNIDNITDNQLISVISNEDSVTYNDDIIDKKEMIKNKKINAFNQLITYKKVDCKSKNVLDYYLEDNSTKIKNINFQKKIRL